MKILPFKTNKQTNKQTKKRLRQDVTINKIVTFTINKHLGYHWIFDQIRQPLANSTDS